MSLQSVSDLSFDFLPSRPVEVQISDSPLSSDAGLMPIRQLDERLRRLVAAPSLPWSRAW